MDKSKMSLAEEIKNNLLVMKKSVIIIDDDEDTPRLFAELLSDYGIKVLAQGYDGKAAVSLYKKHHPDVTLVDIMMPNGNGIYAIKKIREINPDAKIIAVTADVSTLTTEKIKALRIPLVHKPFNIEQVVAQIIYC